MSLWRYQAVAMRGGGSAGALQRGELAGQSAAEVRAALRRIGLQVVELRPARVRGKVRSGDPASIHARARTTLLDTLHRHLRKRRRHQRAELYDSLATMVASGIPLLEAADSLLRTIGSRRSALRSMMADVRESLRSGESLASAMRGHPGWFDGCEVAMVEAAQHGGTLPEVLRGLAEDHERSGELAQKLASALAYPIIVAIVGLGVVVFLSRKTLPTLAGILTDAHIEVPALTRAVAGFGRVLSGNWVLFGLAAAGALAAIAIGPATALRAGIKSPGWVRRFSPAVLRRMALGRLCLRLARLLGSGVPMVEALRVLAPTVPGAALTRRILEGADRVERGEDLSAALDDEHWFDAQFRRLLEVGQASGELEVLLTRLGERYERQARRLIDRLAALLEPCVILALAFLVGLVVMAAVLPLLRLQEIL